MKIPAAIIATPKTAAMAMPAFTPVERPPLPLVPLPDDGADDLSASSRWDSEVVLSLLAIAIVLAMFAGNVSRLSRRRRSSGGELTELHLVELTISRETAGHISLENVPIASDNSSALQLDEKQYATLPTYSCVSHAQPSSPSQVGAKMDGETQLCYKQYV